VTVKSGNELQVLILEAGAQVFLLLGILATCAEIRTNLGWGQVKPFGSGEMVSTGQDEPCLKPAGWCMD